MSGSVNYDGFVAPRVEDLNQWNSSYEFIDLIACGGMGAVYRARQIALDRMVGIKILPPELVVNEAFRKSFEAEGKAMAKVSHANLVGVYDFGEISDMLYLVIEFVDGSNLYESMGGVAIDRDVAVTLVHAVASGLAEAHRMGIVHRDIKPANILINREVVPKLGDFGLAVPDSDIESGLVMGTPAYLAPEVLSDPAAASFSSDTYALGVILYELLCGRSVERGDALDLAFVPPGVNLLEILRKVIHPDPALRFQDGGELEVVLKAWLDRPNKVGLALNAGVGAAPRRVVPLASQQSRGGGGLVIGLVSVLILGLVVMLVLGTGGDTKGAKGESPMPTEEDRPSALSKERVLSDLKASQVRALAKLQERVREKRSANRREFLKAGGEEAEEFLKCQPVGTLELPRYFNNREVRVSRPLLGHVREFAKVKQGEINSSAWKALGLLHVKAIRDLKTAKVNFPEGVTESAGNWVEWLGVNPMKLMQSSMAGSWRFSREFRIRISATGKVEILVEDECLKGGDLIKVGGGGSISVNCKTASNLNFPWTLRWQGDQMVGVDRKGKARVLTRGSYNYTRLLKSVQVE